MTPESFAVTPCVQDGAARIMVNPSSVVGRRNLHIANSYPPWSFDAFSLCLYTQD
jgi:hypothetical protein